MLFVYFEGLIKSSIIARSNKIPTKFVTIELKFVFICLYLCFLSDILLMEVIINFMINDNKDMKNNKPKIALVLGSGGNKGFAYIGVIRALEEAGFVPDIIVGSSMGAIIGACYALGVGVDEMEKRVLELSTGQLLDIKIPNAYGFIKGDRAEKIIRSFLKEKDKQWKFSDCKIPFGCVAADLSTAKVVNLTKGDLLKSVRASFSINGVFRPVKIGKRNLTDGGILCRVPVDLAKKMGADFVLAVDCVGVTQYAEVEKNKYIDTIARIFTIMDYEVSKNEISRADYLISLEQPNISMIRVCNVDESIRIGYETTKAQIDKIMNAIKDAGVK